MAVPIRGNQAVDDATQQARVHPRSAPWLLPALLAATTVLLSLWVIVGWGFDGLYGQDSYTYFSYGTGPMRDFLLTGKQLIPMNWPLGYPTLVALVSLVVGRVSAAGQLVSLLAGAAAVPLTYLLGYELLTQSGAPLHLARRAALFGAALLAVTGWLLQSSVTVMADSLGLTAALLSGWALLRWSRAGAAPDESQGSHRIWVAAGWLGLAGAALAWSIVTRWGQALLVPVWLLAALPAIRARPSRFWRTVPAALLAGGAVLAAQGWLILTVAPHPSLSSLPFAGDLTLAHGAGAGGGWSPAHLIERSFLTPDGSQHYALPNLLYYASAPFRPQNLTPLFAPAALLGVVIIASRYRRALPLVIVWPAVLLLFDAGLAEQNLRFVLMVLPPVAILAGLGVAVAWDSLVLRQRPLLVAAVLAGLLIVAGLGMRDVGRLVDAHNADLQVARWAAARVPLRATTLSFGITLTVQHETRIRPLDLYALSRPRLAQLVSEGRQLYLLVQVDQMAGQWALRSPGADYRFLRDGPGLVRLGALRGYTLFRVRTA
jgi:hypothetical protein